LSVARRTTLSGLSVARRTTLSGLKDPGRTTGRTARFARDSPRPRRGRTPCTATASRLASSARRDRARRTTNRLARGPGFASARRLRGSSSTRSGDAGRTGIAGRGRVRLS
jgi:hypothetical protein